jgi:hypothetical protein
MWIASAVGLPAIAALLVLLLVSLRTRKSSGPEQADKTVPRDIDPASSILKRKIVLASLAHGAPPAPWMLQWQDREAMESLAKFFARAIPNPEPDGKVSVRETPGHGGPQLELYVPVLSTQSPIAVLARNWDPDTSRLESQLFFFGNLNARLAEVVSRAGFEPMKSGEKCLTAFRNRRGVTQHLSARAAVS